MSARTSTTIRLIAGLALACLSVAAGHAQSAARHQLRIEAKLMGEALKDFARQTGLQVLVLSSDAGNKRSTAVNGNLTSEEALTQLLGNTGLTYKMIDERTIAVRAKEGTPQQGAAAKADADKEIQLARVDAPVPAGEDASESTNKDEERSEAGKGIPEMLVKGARTSNIDIQRTEDDVQPYVVFTAEDIQRSMAGSLDQFLMSRLPMNASAYAADVVAPAPYLPQNGNKSSINLRGLGAAQTLILVNGRRVPGVGTSSDLTQPDINGIPMSSVARIEVLPSTAGGIYGGGATGGVINIILKDDYSGAEINARYDGTFRQDAAQRVIEANTGMNLEGGRTTLMLSASHRDSIPLYSGERDFSARSRAQVLKNNPAIYSGPDIPMGNTTNIRSSSGAPLVLASTNQSIGSSFTSVPYGYAGPASDGGAALAANAGKYNLDMSDSVFVARRALTGALDSNALRLNVRRSFTDRIEAFLDASWATNDSTVDAGAAPYFFTDIPARTVNNPFTTPITVSFSANDFPDDHVVTKSSTLNATGGVTVSLPRGWMMQGEYGWGYSENSFSRNQLSSYGIFEPLVDDGTLQVLRDSSAYTQDYLAYASSLTSTWYVPDPQGANMTNLTLRLAGPTFRLPAGPMRLSALLERREDEVDGSITGLLSSSLTWGYRYSPPRKQTTDGAYVELTAPLISAANALPLARALDLQVSFRRDRIGSRTVANTAQGSFVIASPDAPLPDPEYFTNNVEANQYTVGLRYQPVESLALRVSNSVGVLPPSLSQLVPLIRFNVNPGNSVVDPLRNRTRVGVVAEVQSSGNPDLRSEQSDSWSAGAIYTPAFLPGFRFSVDYTRIEKTDEISSVGAQVILDQESTYPERVHRLPLTAEDQAQNYTIGRVAYLSYGMTNIAYTNVEAYDFRADYQWTTRKGVFRVDAMATRMDHLQKQLLTTSPVIDYVGFFDGPLKWRGNAGLTWERNAWTVGWNMQYYDSFPVYGTAYSQALRENFILNQGSEFIPRQVYHDLSVKYRIEGASLLRGILANSEILVGISNVFDAEPPLMVFADTGVGATDTTPYGDPRLRRYSISLRKNFQ